MKNTLQFCLALSWIAFFTPKAEALSCQIRANAFNGQQVTAPYLINAGVFCGNYGAFDSFLEYTWAPPMPEHSQGGSFRLIYAGVNIGPVDVFEWGNCYEDNPPICDPELNPCGPRSVPVRDRKKHPDLRYYKQFKKVLIPGGRTGHGKDIVCSLIDAVGVSGLVVQVRQPDCAPNCPPPNTTPPNTPPDGPGGGCSDGNPVSVATGTMWHQQTDFIVKGRTEQTRLEITRTYMANSSTAGEGFGPNWRHNYESKILQVPKSSGADFDIAWIDENGGAYYFIKNEDGTYQTPEGSRLKLVELSDHFELSKPDRTKYFFGKEVSGMFGLLKQVTERHGESLTFTYDLQARLSTVSAPFAGSITFSYDGLSRITQIHRDRDNLSYFYSYENEGRLAEVTDFQGRKYTFKYFSSSVSGSAEGMLESITDPIGRVLRFTYDEHGRAKQQYEPGGGVWDFAYGLRKTTVRAPNGSVSRYFFDDNFREIKRIMPDGTVHFSEWENGFRKNSCPAFGGKTKFSYDQNGNVASVQRPEDPSPKVITYHQNFNVPLVIEPIVGAPTQFTLDPNTGDVLGVSRGGGALAFTRDQFGNLLSTNNGRATYLDQRDSNGLLTHVFDTHNPEILSYDQRGRVSSRQFLSGRTLTYTYNDDDLETLAQDSHGPTISKVYDAMRRLIRTDVISGSVMQTTLFEYDGKDRLRSTTDALGRKTELIYDPIRVRDRPIAIKDPAGRFAYFEYDSMDRLVRQTNAAGAVTKFTYDQRDNLTSVTDANGNVTSYAFDRNDRKIRETRPSVAGTSPANRTQHFFYDPADRLVREVVLSATGGASRSVNYVFDSLDRLVRKVIQRESSSGAEVEDDSSFTYENQLDADILKTAANGLSSLSFTSSPTPPFSPIGFNVAATQVGNPLQLIEGSFEITRDVTGEIASISKDGAILFSKTYDAAGRLMGVSTPSGFSTTISWDGFGRQSTVTHSTGQSGSFQRDLLNRITQITWTGPESVSETLDYDLAGNVVNLQRENGSYTLAYDVANQLLSSATTGTLNYNRTWGYDLLGNRLQSSHGGPGVFVNNFLLSNGLSSFLADADGFGEVVRETSGAGIKNFGYRADGLLNSFQKATVQAAYYFDSLGRRTVKKIDLGAGPFFQTFVHLGKEDRILMAKAGDGSITTYIDGNGEDEHLAEVKGETGKGYITDHLGSVLNSEAAGASHSFGLFGEPNSTSEISTSSAPVMYGYTGREWDVESALSYHRKRSYSPDIGRWLSQDPIGFEAEDANYYRYVQNSPVSSYDRNGLCKRPTYVNYDQLISQAQTEIDTLEAELATCDSWVRKQVINFQIGRLQKQIASYEEKKKEYEESKTAYEKCCIDLRDEVANICSGQNASSKKCDKAKVNLHNKCGD